MLKNYALLSLCYAVGWEGVEVKRSIVNMNAIE